jgi:hypothetical protein
MSLSLHRRRLIAVVALTVVGPMARPASAGTLAAPAGKVILTISGKIQTQNGTGIAEFDRDMLERLGMQSFTTTTPWHKQPTAFEGIALDRLMQAVGATGERITALALDDYSTDIPIEDFSKYHTILALKRDGEYMPVRDKGPLFIVYPYDSMPELKHQMFYSRSAWQVNRIIVK